MEVALPDLMKQEEFVDYKTLAPKLLALNNWILDGELKSGTGKPAYRSDGASGWVASGKYLKKDELQKNTIQELARSAIAIADDQPFLDANHRTAVLMMFDYLAAVGVDVTRSPLRVHRLIADRKPYSETGQPDAKALQAVEKEIRDRNYKPEGGLTEDQRFSYAAEIKAADQIQDKLDQIGKLVLAAPNQEAKTQVIQKIRKDYGLWLWEVYKRRAKTGRF